MARHHTHDWLALPEDVYTHCFSAKEMEVGGVLIGHPFPKGPPEVTGSIRVPDDWEPAPLAFNQDDWENIHRVIREQFPGGEIVGWYHSYPGYGLFLSEQDRFIHSNWFTNPGQVMFVIDPIMSAEAVFRWKGTEIVELFRRECSNKPPARATARARRPTVAKSSSSSPMLFNLIEVNPHTSLPTISASLYLAVIVFAIGVLIWAAAVR